MKTFIIAEAGINHGGDLNKALSLIDAAKVSGADAVKFQTYTTEKRVAKDNPAWGILKQCELTYEQHNLLKEHADKVGIEYFSTPFDSDALMFLVKDLGVKRIKIASFDVTNTKFLDEVNRYAGLDVIMSVGMSNISEIGNALKHLINNKITLLHCKSSYPLELKNINLAAIQKLKQAFFKDVGFSDHTRSTEATALAVIAGASVIEKHFTLDYSNGAVDNPVSLDPIDFRVMVKNIRAFEIVMGDGNLKLEPCEESTKIFRRYS